MLDTVLFILIHSRTVTKKPKNVLGKQLKAFRMDVQLSQEQLADKMGISRPTIARLERGDTCSDLMFARIQKYIKQQAVAA